MHKRRVSEESFRDTWQTRLPARRITNTRMQADDELKLDPQSPLDHARSAAHGACGGSQRGGRADANGRGDLAKVRAALAEDGIRKIGVVKEIEEVRPELQMDFFGSQREVFGNGKIVVGQAGAVVLVAPGSPNSSCGRVRAAKSVRDGVDGAAEVPIVEGGVRVPVVLMQRACSDNVGPFISLIEPAEVVRLVEHAHWRAA